jgi:hypothetical protein
MTLVIIYIWDKHEKNHYLQNDTRRNVGICYLQGQYDAPNPKEV